MNWSGHDFAVSLLESGPMMSNDSKSSLSQQTSTKGDFKVVIVQQGDQMARVFFNILPFTTMKSCQSKCKTFVNLK